MQSDEVARAFASISLEQKAAFLTRVAFEQTIHARTAYLNYANDPMDIDATALRRSNEFIHKLCGYTLQCLRGNTTVEQDMSVVAMVLDSGHSADDLYRWLAEAETWLTRFGSRE